MKTNYKHIYFPNFKVNLPGITPDTVQVKKWNHKSSIQKSCHSHCITYLHQVWLRLMVYIMMEISSSCILCKYVSLKVAQLHLISINTLKELILYKWDWTNWSRKEQLLTLYGHKNDIDNRVSRIYVSVIVVIVVVHFLVTVSTWVLKLHSLAYIRYTDLRWSPKGKELFYTTYLQVKSIFCIT